MTRPTTEAIACSLERFAGRGGEPTTHDLNLLVHVAAQVGLDVIRWQTWKLRTYAELGNPRLGYDVIADVFVGEPDFPPLRAIARKIVAAAGGEARRASVHFRNEMTVCASNYAKKMLQEANPGGFCIRRNILLHVDPARRRGNRIFFAAPRAGDKQPISSQAHTEELWARLGGREGRIPRLLAATETILAAHPQHASWIELSQLESDYLELMTLAAIWPQPKERSDDPGQTIDYAAVLAYWAEQGAAIACQRFPARTEARPEDIAAISSAYCDYFQVWARSAARVDQYPFLAQFIPGLTPERYRREYRRIFSGLHELALGVLQERFAPHVSSSSTAEGHAPRPAAGVAPAPRKRDGPTRPRPQEDTGWR
jgi:hypothetical protein